MSTGQAAGTAAALSLRAGKTPRQLDPQTVVAQLEKDRDVEPAFAELLGLTPGLHGPVTPDPRHPGVTKSSGLEVIKLRNQQVTKSTHAPPPVFLGQKNEVNYDNGKEQVL
jgi:hypothetical protein